ncbi:MAG TPA: hypothetical protein VE465_13905 [Streptosporangiaceae bacterium]|jgi:hypothetical protein|nr:hypothetical protein [Streptosporangiaceae bacterium]
MTGLRTLVLQQRVEAFLVQLDGLIAPEPTPAEGLAGTDRLIADLMNVAPAGAAAGADRTAPTTTI